MISQFKKLFLSLIFTVALCCGLSVSAFATDYYYGSVLAPALPSVDDDLYPYCVVYDISPRDSVRLVYSSVPFAFAKKAGQSYTGFTIPQSANVIWYTLSDGVWQYNTTVIDDVAYGLYLGSDVIKSLWVNHDVLDNTNSVVYPAQKPVLSNQTVDILDFLSRTRLTSSPTYSATNNYYLSYGANTVSNLLPVYPDSEVSVFGFVNDNLYNSLTFSLWFLDASGIDKVSSGLPLVSVSDYVSTGHLPWGSVVQIPDGTKAVWLELYQGGRTLLLSDFSSVYFGYSSVVSSYSPAITATTYSVTDTTVDLAINVTGMNLVNTYNIRIDGTTADGEELSQVIGTITGEETYSTSATLGPFTPNTTYTATLVLVEDGVDVSSSLISFTTLPDSGVNYDPQITASQFAVTSTTMTSQVTLSGLDPSKQYRPYYRLSLADDDTVISQGYALDIMPVTGIGEYTAFSRINNLTANTEYRIIWALFEDGTEYVDAFDYFNFTTLDDCSGGGDSGSSDDDSGILLMILNKVSAILDTMNGGQSEGILASINEKLDALIDTLANPEEQQLEDNFKGSLTEVNNNFFGDTAKGQAVTVSDVGNLADTQSTVKTIFQSDYTVADFFGLFSDNSFFGWFSAETAIDLNPISYGGVSVADMDDPYNMQAYYDNLEKVRGKK